MKEKLLQAVKIASAQYDLVVPDFEQIELFPLEGVKPHSFEEFLIRSRVHLFLKLFILNQLEDTSFVPAHEELIRHKIDETKSETEEDNNWIPIGDFGPNIFNCAYSINQLFEEYLERTAVSALLIRERVKTEGVGRIGTEGPINLENELVNLWGAPEIFIMVKPKMELIITDKDVFVDKENKELIENVKGVVKTHKEQFAKFVEKYKETCVPHAVYVEWLMKWYPGKVHLRSIENHE